MSEVHPSCIIYPEVYFPADARVDAFVILGEGLPEQRFGTSFRIGKNAHVRSHSVIYFGNQIGDNFQTGHGVLVREFNRIGNSVSIGSHSIVEHHVEIQDGVRIHSNAFIPEYSVLEALCWIGPCVVVTNARYPQSPRAKENLQGVHIERQARIGAGAVLLPGVRIGAGALVGAGAVVTHHIPPGAVVVGNPAQQIKTIDQIEAYNEKQ